MLKSLGLGAAVVGLMLSACGSDAAGPVKVFDDEVVFVESGFSVRAHLANTDKHDVDTLAHTYVLHVPDTICADEDVECLALYLETLSWVEDLEYGDLAGASPIQFRIPGSEPFYCVASVGRRIDVGGPVSLWESAGDGPGLWQIKVFC